MPAPQPRCGVHHITHGGEVIERTLTDVSHKCLSEVEADPHLDKRLFGGP
jgi:hypothetical protein